MLEGDEWKTRRYEEKQTREQEQHRSDGEYAFGQITLGQWSAEFDRLSTLSRELRPLKS